MRKFTAQTLDVETAYTCTVGQGGAGVIGSNQNAGGNSSFAGSGITTLTSTGGGGAANDAVTGGNGRSGS